MVDKVVKSLILKRIFLYENASEARDNNLRTENSVLKYHGNPELVPLVKFNFA